MLCVEFPLPCSRGLHPAPPVPGTSPLDAPHTPHTSDSGGSPVMSPRTSDPPSAEHSPRPSSDEISMTPPGGGSGVNGASKAPKGLNFGRFPNAPPPSAPAIGPSDSPPTGTPDTSAHLGRVLLSPHHADITSTGRPVSIGGPRSPASSPVDTRLRNSPQGRPLESPGRNSGRGSFSAYDTTPRLAGPRWGREDGRGSDRRVRRGMGRERREKQER
jgi:hypothetical protein